MIALNLDRAGKISLSHNETTDPIWRAIAGHPVAIGDMSAAWLNALSDLISAAGVSALIPAAVPVLGAGNVRQAQLLNRFRRLQGEKWSAVLNTAGIRAVAMKGLSTAHAVWPHPDARAVSDADLLVAPHDLSAAVDVLAAEGFAFADVPTRGPWGFVGDASFQPLVGPGDSSNVDLHIQGDSWPFVCGLAAAEILAEARESDVSGVWLPTATHRFLIAASHAAGDLFTPDAIKSVVDALLMLRRSEEIDFVELRMRAQAARLLKPVNLMFALLGHLGADLEPCQAAGFHPETAHGRTFDQLVSDHNSFFQTARPPGLFGRLRREAILCAEPRVVIWRNGRRLTGLVRPRTGLPDRHHS